MFILVTLFLPMGLSSLWGKAKSAVWRPRPGPTEPAAAPPVLEEVMK